MIDAPPKSLLDAHRDRQERAHRAKRRRQAVDHAAILNIFGRPLERLRKRTGRSMLKAAIESGISDNTVWRIESGENARLSSVINLAKTYGYRVELRFIPNDPKG